jgi:hypothetical protein
MKVLVCGDRNWKNKKVLDYFLGRLPITELIHGGCKGADMLAAAWAAEHEIPCREFEADWDKHGKAAGPIRNRQMLDERPKIVVAFHDFLPNSKGTRDCVTEAKKRGIVTVLISSPAAHKEG